MTEAPFKDGDVVRIKGDHHLGLHRVDNCEWFDRTKPGVPHYWLCECTQIRDPIDWSKIAPGATGIVTGSYWRGSSEHLEDCAVSPPDEKFPPDWKQNQAETSRLPRSVCDPDGAK